MRYGKEKVREESRHYGRAVPNAAVRFDPARPVGPPPYLFLSTLTLTLTFYLHVLPLLLFGLPFSVLLINLILSTNAKTTLQRRVSITTCVVQGTYQATSLRHGYWEHTGDTNLQIIHDCTAAATQVPPHSEPSPGPALFAGCPPVPPNPQPFSEPRQG